MARRLTILTRMLVLVLTLTSLLALAVAGIESPANSNSPVLSGRWDSIHEENWPRRDRESENFYLVDREAGRCASISLPSEGRWSSLSVSPWSSRPNGPSEAVGLCFHAPSQRDNGGFLGLVRLRLPEGRIIDRVQVEILPTSRPCWAPDRPGSIVFAAGDGQLYRHDFDDAIDLENASAETAAPGTSRVPLQPLVWNCPPPSTGASYLNDPTWPAHPRLRHFLFVTLIGRPLQAGGRPGKGSRLWWLRMNEDGLSIDACGPLFEPQSPGTARETIERFPTLAVNRTGEILLAYLTHNPGQIKGGIQAVQIQVDPSSEKPAVVAGSNQIVAEDCATLPPVFSVDGKTLFAVSARTGQLMKYPVKPTAEGDSQITVAGKD